MVEITNLETCVVRVERADGDAVAGTGFLVASDLAVTCAHIVRACGAGPGERLRMTFRAGGAPVGAEVLTDGWHLDQNEPMTFRHWLTEQLCQSREPGTGEEKTLLPG